MNAMKFAVPLFVALAYGPSQGLATPILAPDLASFAVLGADGVTNVPISIIGGNLGSSPNASVGGGYIFTAGSLQKNTATAQQAQLDLDAAIIALNAFGVGTSIPNTLSGGNLDAFQALAINGGKIGPGTYTVDAQSVNLMGALVLDGGGNNTALWVFQFPSTLITSTTSTVIVQNVGDGAHVGVYWNVHSAATLNGPTFVGNVLAHDLISSDGDLTIACGRLLSAETQVTLIHDSISIGCTGAVVTGPGGAAVGTSAGFAQSVPVAFVLAGGSNGQVVPEPATLALLSLGLAGLGFSHRRKSN